jgi:glyoxylase-like metal-dependent hydrolase (beta-lactamase superfamily II)
MALRVHHINCGTMCPASAALINGSGGLLERGRMVCHCLLIETPSGLMLVDTGLGTQDVADPVGRLGRRFVTLAAPQCQLEETALAQVKARGLAPEDVRFILPTHLDLDHAGGLGDFPSADVHLLRAEHDAATRRATFQERSRYRRVHFAHDPRWRIHEPDGERWFGFEAVRPLPGTHDEVLIIPLYGHTRGHAGIAVRSQDGWILHAGDAYFHHNGIHPTGQKVPLGLTVFEKLVETDRAQRLYNRERLRKLAREHGSEVRILCAHDPGELG